MVLNFRFQLKCGKGSDILLKVRSKPGGLVSLEVTVNTGFYVQINKTLESRVCFRVVCLFETGFSSLIAT